MNLVVLFLVILFTLFGTFTCAVLPQPSNSVKQNDSNIGREELESSSTLLDEKKLNKDFDDHPGDHGQKIVPRKGVNNIERESDDVKVTATEHSNHNTSSDRASTTITKNSESQKNGTSQLSSPTNTKDEVTNSSKTTSSDKYSPSESKSTLTETSHTSSNISKSEYASASNTSKSSATNSTESASTNTSKSSATKSTESASTNTSKSSATKSTELASTNTSKPLFTYSVEDDPSLLNVPIVRQLSLQLTPIDTKAESDYAGYLPPSSDQMQTSKGALYVFPLVVLIFLVPMVLGIGIIVLRRVRDYWSTRHYRRMDFLVDGMYNT